MRFGKVRPSVISDDFNHHAGNPIDRHTRKDGSIQRTRLLGVKGHDVVIARFLAPLLYAALGYGQLLLRSAPGLTDCRAAGHRFGHRGSRYPDRFVLCDIRSTSHGKDA